MKVVPKYSREERLVEDLKFQALYENYQLLVRKALYNIAGVRELDDLVQECFVKVWKALPKFKGDSKLSTWIYRIAVNTALDHCRKKKQSFVSNEGLSVSSPEGRILKQDLVRTGLGLLSADHRAVLVLASIEGFSITEIAEILEIPEGTVKSRLFHARKSMAEFLEKQGVSL